MIIIVCQWTNALSMILSYECTAISSNDQTLKAIDVLISSNYNDVLNNQ